MAEVLELLDQKFFLITINVNGDVIQKGDNM